jgi:hypothetical protein
VWQRRGVGRVGDYLTHSHTYTLSHSVDDSLLTCFPSMLTQLAARQSPVEELLNEAKRLRADNSRLVAILAEVPSWKRVAEEMGREGGLHYIPVQEALVAKVGAG